MNFSIYSTFELPLTLNAFKHLHSLPPKSAKVLPPSYDFTAPFSERIRYQLYSTSISSQVTDIFGAYKSLIKSNNFRLVLDVGHKPAKGDFHFYLIKMSSSTLI